MNDIISTVSEDLSSEFSSIFDSAKLFIEQVLRDGFNRWKPSKEAVERYPFLADKNAFVNFYISCFGYEPTREGSDFIFDVQKFRARKYPENFQQVLEYGDEYVPPLPHIQPLVEFIDEKVNLVYEG